MRVQKKKGGSGPPCQHKHICGIQTILQKFEVGHILNALSFLNTVASAMQQGG